MLAIRLPEEIEGRLTALAASTGRTKTFYAREAILTYLDDLEDYYKADARKADLDEGRSDAVSLADLKKQHGLDG